LVLLNANDMFHGIEPVRPVEKSACRAIGGHVAALRR
jgi:hypothetical protein